MNIKIEMKEHFKMFGIERVISMVDGQNFIDIPQFWDECLNNGTVDQLSIASGTPLSSEHVGLFNVHGLMAYKETEKDTFPYMIAAMVQANSNLEGYDVVTIPALEWAIFKSDHYTSETLSQTVQGLWHYIFSEWFPTSGYQHDKGPELELYGTDGPDKEYCEVWIPITK